MNSDRKNGAMKTTPEIAKELGVGINKVLSWIESGELAAIDLRGPGSNRSRYKVTQEAIEDFLARRTTGPKVRQTRKRRNLADTVPKYV